MKTAFDSCSSLKRLCFRWMCFGVVIYVLLFVTIKWEPPLELDWGTMKHICESSPVFKPHCNCDNRASFKLPTRGPQIETVEKARINPNSKHHVAFVKTHKAASSTVLNILYRFAKDRDLVLLLPRSGNYLQGRYLNKTSLLPPPNGKTYDILCNHAIFNYTSFAKFLPPDTVYISIVREPFQRFLSAFYYYRYVIPKKYLTKVPGGYTQILRNYLMSPTSYEPRNPLDSMTNNRMVIDFGFPPSLFYNDAAFNEYILHLNRTFSVVMVSERFDESLVLLKRLLNWGIKDILYTVKNKARVKSREGALIHKYKKYYENLSNLDKKLYDFFVKKLNVQIAQQGPLFAEEVKYFQTVRQKVTEFCSTTGRKALVTIPKSDWTEGLEVNRRDCTFLKIEELQFLGYLRNLHTVSLRRFGPNVEFWKSLPG